MSQSLKDQLGVIITYLIKRGPGEVAAHRAKFTSVSGLVAKVLDEWKKMPEHERKMYEDIYMKDGLNSKIEKHNDKR